MEYRVPFGYRIRKGKISICKEQAQIVNEIFQRYDNGIPMIHIAKELNDREVVYTGGRATWTHVIVGKVLENRVYLGDGYYPQLIEEEQFNRIQERRKQYCKQRGCGEYLPDKVERKLFEGILICDECGARYRRIRPGHPEQKWRIPKWECRHNQNEHDVVCTKVKLTDDQVKKICVQAINRIIEDEGIVREAAEPEMLLSKKYIELDEQINMFETGCTEDLVDLLMERAEERYKTLIVRDVRLQTEMILHLTEDIEKLQEFDEDLYRKIVKEIRIYSDHNARVVFINGSGVYVRF